MRHSMNLLAAVAAIALAHPGYAQEKPAAGAPAADAADADAGLGEIIVTAQAKGQTRLKSSISVSTLSNEDFAKFAPRSVSDLIRNIPGLRSEASGGESNANVSFRGVPIASGGAKYAQFQEDGLGVFEFGDILFANADGFLKSDYTVERVEVVRGGSASTFVSNAPSGVINFISKTGREEGGSVGITRGIDYDTTRFDFNYGSPINDSLRFNVGGFYRIGEGVRSAGYNAENGGQVKANITKEFSNGFVRLSLKYLNDRTPTYLPVPFQVTGTALNPKYNSVPGLNGKKDSLLSANFRTASGIDPFGNRFQDKLDDGFHAVTKQVGLDFSFDVADGFTITDSAKYARNGGAFVSPFVASVGTAASAAAGTPGGAFIFANGPNRGQAYTGLVASVVLFDVRLNNLDNFANNLKISKSFGGVTATAGYYKSKQNVGQTWNWTSFYEQVSGNNAALLDLRGTPTVANPSGLQTNGGQAGYNASFFGACCERIYDATYDTDAPYLSLAYEQDKLNVDGSVRFDYGKATGTYSGQGIPSAVGPGTIAAPQDFNGDGRISPIEAGIVRVDLNNPAPINYKYHYTSYSFGANYAFTDSFAAFARYSKGARANADRLLFSPTILADGSALNGGVTNDVRQTELGVKVKGSGYRLFATAFYARTNETNYDPTRPIGSQFSDKAYRAYGLEVEGNYQIDGFSLSAGATYTKSKIFKDALSLANIGSPGQRQAKFIYQASADYVVGPARVGLNLVGTTKSFTNDNQRFIQPGYTTVNGFVDFNVVERLKLSINANNLFNTLGITEVGNDSLPANGLVTARAISGRTISGAIKLDF